MRFSIILTVAVAFLVAIPAQAATLYLNDSITQRVSDTEVAQLDYNFSTDYRSVSFSLTDIALNSFGSGSFLGALIVDYAGTFNKDKYQISGISGGVGAVELKKNGSSDFRFDFKDDHNRLTNGETLNWTLAFNNNAPGAFSDNSFVNFQAHVQGISTIHGISSAKFDSNTSSLVTPVPEPETWGMLLVGLGLISMKLRRKDKEEGGHCFSLGSVDVLPIR